MDRFRTLVYVVLISGTIAGSILFAVQHFTTYPLIEKAEVFESAAEKAMPGMQHDDDGWRPADGVERTLFTLLTTILVAVGFSALLFGTAASVPIFLDWQRGALWGMAAYVCIDLAPSLGLPPQPPGVPVADLYSRQLWWTFTAIATASGLWLIFSRKRAWQIRLAGLPILILPHAIGAPAATGESIVPAALIHQFITASLITTGIFWLTLGSIGGLIYRRCRCAEGQ